MPHLAFLLRRLRTSGMPWRSNRSSFRQIQSVTIRVAISAFVFPRIPIFASCSRTSLAVSDSESCALSVLIEFLPLTSVITLYLQVNYNDCFLNPHIQEIAWRAMVRIQPKARGLTGAPEIQVACSPWYWQQCCVWSKIWDQRCEEFSSPCLRRDAHSGANTASQSSANTSAPSALRTSSIPQSFWKASM